MKAKEYLKKHVRIASMPVVVKFKRKNTNDWAKFDARKGDHVISVRKMRKYIKMLKGEIEQRIKSHNSHTMGEILDEDIKEWLK